MDIALTAQPGGLLVVNFERSRIDNDSVRLPSRGNANDAVANLLNDFLHGATKRITEPTATARDDFDDVTAIESVDGVGVQFFLRTVAMFQDYLVGERRVAALETERRRLIA